MSLVTERMSHSELVETQPPDQPPNVDGVKPNMLTSSPSVTSSVHGEVVQNTRSPVDRSSIDVKPVAAPAIVIATWRTAGGAVVNETAALIAASAAGTMHVDWPSHSGDQPENVAPAFGVAV